MTTEHPLDQMHSVRLDTELAIVEVLEEWGDDIEDSEITVEQAARRTAYEAIETI